MALLLPLPARLSPSRPAGRGPHAVTNRCMFSASPSQRPDPHHHLAASSHRGARQLRPHDPLRWVPESGGRAAPLTAAPLALLASLPAVSEAPRGRGRSSHPSFPAFFLFLSLSPLPCRPAPRMGGGLFGGGRQLLHRVSTALPRAVHRRSMAGGAGGAAPARPRGRLKRRAVFRSPLCPPNLARPPVSLMTNARESDIAVGARVRRRMGKVGCGERRDVWIPWLLRSRCG